MKGLNHYVEKEVEYIQHPGKFVADFSEVAQKSAAWVKDKTLEQAQKSEEGYRGGDIARAKTEGKIAAEIVFDVATLGGGTAVKGAQVLSKGEKIIESVNALAKTVEAVSAAEKAVEIGRGVDKAADLAKGIETVASAADKAVGAVKGVPVSPALNLDFEEFDRGGFRKWVDKSEVDPVYERKAPMPDFFD